MKQRINQKGFSFIHVILFIVLIGIIGFTGWYVYRTNHKDNNIQENTANLTTTKPKTTSTNQITIPNGWVKFEDKNLAISFAYPENWGKPTVTDRTNIYYFEKFTNTSSTEGDPKTIYLASNSGRQDFSEGRGRGGALWDAVGYKNDNNNYFLLKKYIDDNGPYSGSKSISKAEIIKGVNTDVLFGEFNYFEVDFTFATVNTSGEYYGFMIMTESTNSDYVALIKELSKTFKVL